MELNEKFDEEMMMRMYANSTMVILLVQSSVRKSHLILIDVFLIHNAVRRGRRTNGSMLIIIDEAGVCFVCLHLLMRHYCTLSRIVLDASALVFMLQHFSTDQLSSDDSPHVIRFFYFEEKTQARICDADIYSKRSTAFVIFAETTLMVIFDIILRENFVEAHCQQHNQILHRTDAKFSIVRKIIRSDLTLM